MTPEELMKLADAYAQAAWLAHETADKDPAAQARIDKARAALAEALNLTSQFGGL